MIGGRLIEIRYMTLPETGREVVRLWCVESRFPHDELCVYAEPGLEVPDLLDEVWWQGGRVYFDGDRKTLAKVGHSFPAPCLENE